MKNKTQKTRWMTLFLFLCGATVLLFQPDEAEGIPGVWLDDIVIEVIAAEQVIQGDCDEDGQLTIDDAICALNMSVGLIQPKPDTMDITGDGKVTSGDARAIIQRIH